MAGPDSPLGLCMRYRDAFFARDVDALMALVTPDIQVRDGRICRNAVYSSAHAARELDQPT
jgi:hypothetical protein